MVHLILMLNLNSRLYFIFVVLYFIEKYADVHIFLNNVNCGVPRLSLKIYLPSLPNPSGGLW